MSKKLVTLLLTLSLVLSASTPAFAADPADTGTSSSEKTEVTADTTENLAASSETTGTSETSGTAVSSESSEPSESPEQSDPSTSSDPSDPAKTEADSTDTDQQESTEKTDQETAENTEVEKDKADQAKKEKADAKKKAAAKKSQKYRDGLASYIRGKNPSLSKSWSKTLAGYFIAAGKKYDLDPTILMAIAQRESTFRAKATSPYGIKGMMQTSDALARHYGYKPSSLYKAKVSIDVGARYLSSAKKKFGNYTKALSSYVYGSYAVSKGNYSTSHAKSMLKIRRNIKAYLKKYDFV